MNTKLMLAVIGEHRRRYEAMINSFRVLEHTQ